MSQNWEEFEGWLVRLATGPLPGGVAAAAIGAAMGAALMAKVSRITLLRGSLTEAERTVVEATLALAEVRRPELMALAAADEQAFRAVLAGQAPPAGTPEWHQSWHRATEIPVQLAEVCGSLLDWVPALSNCCWPSVRTDLQAAALLLDSGRQTGMQAAASNLLAWGEGPEANSFRARIQTLEEETGD